MPPLSYRPVITQEVLIAIALADQDAAVPRPASEWCLAATVDADGDRRTCCRKIGHYPPHVDPSIILSDLQAGRRRMPHRWLPDGYEEWTGP